MAIKFKEDTAVITTGGTIGSAFGEGVTTLNHDSQLLKQQIEAIAKKHKLNLRTFAPFSMFSEDMQPEDWGRIMQQVDACIALGYKKIVIAHGTDTMAYSAAATSLYFSDYDQYPPTVLTGGFQSKSPFGPIFESTFREKTKSSLRRKAAIAEVKICFTGAFYPPSDPKSDAAPNIEAALLTVNSEELPAGVYVAFRRQGEEIALMRAQDVSPMAPDKTYFEALYGDTVGYVLAGQEVTLTKLSGPQLSINGPPPTPKQLAKAKNNVIQVPCYPAMSLKNLSLNFDPAEENLIVLTAYHSGTMPALALKQELLDLKKIHPRTRAILAMHPYRYVKSPYETTANLAKEGVLNVYRDLLPHQIYVLAVCELAKGKTIYSIMKTLEPWRFGDFKIKRKPLMIEDAVKKGNERLAASLVADASDRVQYELDQGNPDTAFNIFSNELQELMWGMRGGRANFRRRLRNDKAPQQ